MIYDTTLGWRFINSRMSRDFPPISLGQTAENLAEKYQISRSKQDEFALASHKRAVAATKEGRLKDEIVPMGVGQGEQMIYLEKDEGPRENTSLEALAKLKPVFKEGGTVTAGNSSPLSDGAAVLLLMSREMSDKLGMKPIGRVVATAAAGVHPSYMGIGPVPATNKLLKRTGISLDEIDVVEINEAYAAQILAVLVELPVRPERLNPNGGAIALGHPIGCSGARIATTLLHEMRRRRSRYGLASLCIGVGQGITTLFERAE
jgi:acetyl-CoA C-acetyltransferase/3-oxo-5,6-didehydrosuberyl-CoA/3-oxoadipyl-CoA thiolase